MSDFKITVRNNGPLRLEGEITLCDQVSLCRRGQPAIKPFGDGSHARVGFTSEVHAVGLAAPAQPPAQPKPQA